MHEFKTYATKSKGRLQRKETAEKSYLKNDLNVLEGELCAKDHALQCQVSYGTALNAAIMKIKKLS